ncbi:MAG: type II secretion system F family protein [Synergistaceae bacterium]|jgi:type IV pilus assembly protein PilC|nr:type II secretion system F family protein [Synergistaceae bacterium]
MNFKYRARGMSGVVEGTLNAADIDEVAKKLRGIGMTPISVTEAPRRRSLLDMMRRIGTVPLKSKMMLLRKMAAMVQAGLNLGVALHVAAQHERNPILRDAVESVRGLVDQGHPMSRAMTMHSRVFSDMTTSLVMAGEENGAIEESLDMAAKLLENQAALRNKLRSATLYPAFVIAFALGVVVFFTIAILPRFRSAFSALRVEMPALTAAMFGASEFCVNHSAYILAALAGLALGLIWLFSSKKAKPFADRLTLTVPIVSDLVVKSAMARSARVLASMVSTGVPIIRGLEMARGTVGNAVIEKGYDALLGAAQRGDGLADQAARVSVFPAQVCHMIRIGEETGRLADMLHHVAGWYEDELDERIESMVALLNPVMIIFVGGMVALIAAAILGPITAAITQLS